VAGGELPGASRRAVPSGRMTPPPGVCENCFKTWLASQPRPKACYCWHRKALAKPKSEGGWKIIRHVTPYSGLLLRKEGLL
jgi:hypothetical protein